MVAHEGMPVTAPWGERPTARNGAAVPPEPPSWAGSAEADLAEERARLEADIAAASARAAAARARAAARDAELRAALRDELTAAREELAELERQHEVAVEMIRRAAQDEVDRIVARAARPEETRDDA